MSTATADEGTLSPLLLSVLANRFDAVLREMSNTLLRAARSAVINGARDFSCGITTAEDEMFSSAEGLPVHIFGLHLQTRSMRELHPDLAEGDGDISEGQAGCEQRHLVKFAVALWAASGAVPDPRC